MKKILIVSYSQSGQLSDIIKSLSQPLESDDIEIHYKYIEPQTPFPYPWNFFSFMDAFPESVYLDSCEIKPIKEDNEDYDLIILAYQVWFLSPSLPITAFLKSSYAKEKLSNKPVITVIGCRNMWLMAQEKVKKLLTDINAKLIDNITFIDQGNSLATFITTPRWMFTGKKDSLWGIFPKAGVSDKDISNASRFGYAIKEALSKDLEQSHTSLCTGLKAAKVNEKLIKSEQIGHKSFLIWGKLIKKLGKQGDWKRKPILLVYTLFLILMIITVVPINMGLQILIRKIKKDKIAQEKAYYEMPSGNDDFRMKEFTIYE